MISLLKLVPHARAKDSDLPKAVKRVCPYDGKICVEPDDLVSVWDRERVVVPACIRCICF
jgi:hypothetical protein